MLMRYTPEEQVQQSDWTVFPTVDFIDVHTGFDWVRVLPQDQFMQLNVRINEA